MLEFDKLFTTSSLTLNLNNEKDVPIAILNEELEEKVLSNLFTDGLLEKFAKSDLLSQLNSCKVGFYRDSSVDDTADFPKVNKTTISSNWAIAEKLDSLPIQYILSTKNNQFLGVVLHGQILWIGCQIRYLVTKITFGDNNGAGYKGAGEEYQGYDYKTLLFNPSLLISDVFFKDESLKNQRTITVPEGILSIDSNAFSGFDKLEKVTLPSTLTKIGNFAFSKCHALKEITIPDKIEKISYGSFEKCSALKEITLPNSVTTIENSAFSDCSNVKKITLPVGKVMIGAYAFANCVNLEEIVNSTSIRSMSDHAFDNCKSLKNITLSKDFSGSISQFAFYNCKSLKTFSVPKNTFQISCYAFSECSSLEEIYIPETVGIFNGDALFNCPALKKIVIGKNFKSELEEKINLSKIKTIEYV